MMTAGSSCPHCGRAVPTTQAHGLVLLAYHENRIGEPCRGGGEPACRCSLGATPTSCSWSAFVATLPPDDPVWVRDEAGDPNQDWDDLRWSGEGCRCACHDKENP